MRVTQKPKYEATLFSDPSKKVKYRPFIIEEERNLLMALEARDFNQVITTIRDMVEACTGLEVESLPYFDLENLFVKIRSKSVGELIDMIGQCDCKEDGSAKTEFQMNLDEIAIEGEVLDPVIQIPDSDYFVEMRYPNSADVITAQDEDGIDFAAKLIKKVWNSEEVFDNPTLSECKEFILSLNDEQYAPIDKFYEKMPVLSLKQQWFCKHCGKEHSARLTGMEDFFV